MIETDILYAHVKTADWLKSAAEKLLRRIVRGELGQVYASRETLHELYYVSIQEGISIDTFIQRLGALTSIPNITYLETTWQTDILASVIMKQFRLDSIFDAYHAATALMHVRDKTIISTDNVFDKVTGLNRVDPRSIQ